MKEYLWNEGYAASVWKKTYFFQTMFTLEKKLFLKIWFFSSVFFLKFFFKCVYFTIESCLSLIMASGSQLKVKTIKYIILASGGVISRTCNFGVISRTFLKRVNFKILFLHINFCSCHFQRTGLKLLEPVVRTGLPLIIKKLEDFVWRVLWSTLQIMFQSLFLKSRQLCSQ